MGQLLNLTVTLLIVHNEKDAQMFCISKKSRTFASRILSNCTKGLVFSALLRQVSVVIVAAKRLGACFLELLIN